MRSQKHSLLTLLLVFIAFAGGVAEVSCQTVDPAAKNVAKTQTRYPALIYYSLLNDTQKRHYKKLYNEISNAKTSIIFPNVELTDDEWKTIYYAVLNDHPEIFWCHNGFQIAVTYQDDRPTSKFITKTNSLFNNLENNKRLFKDETEKILSIARNYKSSEKREKYIHDYLNRTITYEHSETDQTAFAAIVDHKCVCNGYSAAFKYLMDQLDVNTWIVDGKLYDQDAGQPLNHAWNIIELDGVLYNVDVTANQINKDPDFNDLNFPSYTEYNRDDKHFKKEGYIRDSELNNYTPKLPECSSDNYNVTKRFSDTEIINTYAYNLKVQPLIVKTKDDYLKMIIDVLKSSKFINDVKTINLFFIVYGNNTSDYILSMSHEEELKGPLNDYAYDSNYNNRKKLSRVRIKIAEGVYLHRFNLTITRYH